VLPEQHNLRAALDWAADHDVELGLRLAVALENFWITHDPGEGVRRFERLIAQAEGLDLLLRARAYRDYGGCADWGGDHRRARRAYARSGKLFRAAGDDAGVATAVFRLGVVAARTGDRTRAGQLWEASRTAWEQLGDDAGVVQALGNLGWLAYEEGDRDRARELFERSISMARELGWSRSLALTLGSLAELELEAGRIDEAEPSARESLAIAHEIRDRALTVSGLARLGWAAAERGDTERAAALWSAVEAEEEKGPIAQWTQFRDTFAAHIPTTTVVVALPLDEAVGYALSPD
jgi:tetratricopeptide (TPR) repeat protein